MCTLKIGIVDSFDPDNDGFVFTLAEAKELHCQINMLQFIRRKILGSKSKYFDVLVPMLEHRVQARLQLEAKLPEDWQVGEHDRGLLKHVTEKGFSLEDIQEWIDLSEFESPPTS